MTSSKLLIPLRIPELGPSLGKLITGTGSDVRGFSLETHRYQLVTKIIEMGGEARRLAANDERAAALACVGRDAWLAVWEEIVGPIAAGQTLTRWNAGRSARGSVRPAPISFQRWTRSNATVRD